MLLNGFLNGVYIEWYCNRNVLQLHHVHGGIVSGVDGGGAKLPPSDCGHTWDAAMGKFNFILP